MITTYFDAHASNALSKRILKLLHVKTKDYEYEDEVRFVLKEKLPDNKSTMVKTYDHNIVSSIIFGSRMDLEHKKYIINNIPFQIPFKQAIECKSSIATIILEDYDARIITGT